MSIEEKFGEYCRLNKGKAQVSKKSAFIQGYCLAEKEMQEKLDEAAKHMSCSCSGFEERIRILKENLGFK